MALFIADIACAENEQMSISGVVEIVDFTGTTGGHLLQLTPSLAKKSSVITQVSCRPFQISLHQNYE